MSPRSKKEYLGQIRDRYKTASKNEKKLILDEFCEVCGYNRKYAIRLINSKSLPHQTKSRRGRKKHYTDPLIKKVLFDIWVATNLPCSKRLKALLPLWLPFYDDDIPDLVYLQLLSISPASIDRVMKPDRDRYTKRGLSTTKPGSLLKKKIPVKTDQWDETRPGFVEVDGVAHCGTSTAGMFAYTINCVDIATSWTEQRAVWGKGERGVMQSIVNIENSLPFDILGFDCDNGSEFLNWHLYRYFVQRNKPVAFTRSRPYRKNDNAHVEGKNWTHIRQYLGYERFDDIEIVEQLNDLYTTEWRLYFNFFIPSAKLIKKERVGSKVIKKYDQPKTPFQRIKDSSYIDQETKTELQKQFEQLNPFDLQKKMSNKIKRILKNVNRENKL
jgi:hypothetical protein